MPFKNNKPMRQRLTLYFTFIAIMCCVVLELFYFSFQTLSIKRQMDVDHRHSIEHTILALEEQIQEVRQFSTLLCQNDSLQDLLLMSDPSAYPARQRIVINTLKDEFRYLPVTEQILSLFIIGNNGLDIRAGQEASLSDRSAVISLTDQCDLTSRQQIVWLPEQENLTELSNHSTVLPYIQSIIDVHTGRTLGHLVILFQNDLFTANSLSHMDLEQDAVCLISPDGNLITCNEIWSDFYSKDEMPTALNVSSDSPSAVETINGKLYILYHSEFQYGTWQVVDITSLHQLSSQIYIMLVGIILAFLVALILSLFFAHKLSSHFTEPISAIITEVNQLSAGDFNRSIPTPDDPELRALSSSIQSMQTSISTLIESERKHQEEEKKVQIRMMRAQINPHFLYNTLNSIKMMAQFQGAYGIQKMTEAIGTILRSSLQNPDVLHSVSEEIQLIEKYIYIQNMRYKGNIRFDQQIPHGLITCSVPSFVIQPLVENAIIHGIEADGSGGTILLSAYADEKYLFITVWDDGVGMPAEQIPQLDSPYPDDGSHIGVRNVHHRLKLRFGAPCGLSIESEAGCFTKVTVQIPRLQKGENSDKNSNSAGR